VFSCTSCISWMVFVPPKNGSTNNTKRVEFELLGKAKNFHLARLSRNFGIIFYKLYDKLKHVGHHGLKSKSEKPVHV
jgi:hypothetical protein